MIVRIAGGKTLSRALTARSLSSSTPWADKERNIFVEAAEEESAEAEGGRSLLTEQRARMAQEPIWNGEERLQDTILRMIMDKHQPLRVKGGNAGQHPADAKLWTIQRPLMVSSTNIAAPTPSPALLNVDQLDAGLPPAGEDGRRLAKTPADMPWRAVYVNPLRREGSGEAMAPSVHYGKYLGMPLPSTSRPLPKTATGKERLKLAGIKTEALPLDDRNKMKAIREGVRRWDRAGRMRGVKEEATNYRRAREEERSRTGRPMTDEELEEYLDSPGVLREGEEMKLTSGSSDSKPGEAVIAMSGGRGFSSLANERIEAAMKTDYFQRNALRGKPLDRDIHAMNPFLKGEEVRGMQTAGGIVQAADSKWVRPLQRIMNRLIQRQGASPPWVELNSQVESETSDWRARLVDNWLRRASRMILSSAHMRRGLEPLQTEGIASFATLQASSLSGGQQKMVTLALQYRDAEWEARERDYHEASLKEVNSIIRKYNVVAPASVRKGLLVRERELERVYEEARVRLVRRLSDGLHPSSSSPTAFSLSSRPGAEATGKDSGIGSPLGTRSSTVRSSRLGSGGAGGGDEDAGGSLDGEQLFPTRRKHTTPSLALQLGSLVKRITRQLVGR